VRKAVRVESKVQSSRHSEGAPATEERRQDDKAVDRISGDLSCDLHAFGTNGGEMLIDGWMPAYDAVERHETTVDAPPARVWAALRTLDLSRSPVVRVLFALRSLPALFSGKTREKALGTTMERLQENGFVLLEEKPEEEVVLGVVGRFWRPSGGIVRVSAEEFRAFDRPGYAMGAWNFTLAPLGGRVRLATETRVRCTDDASRRAFLRYWRLVGPFSGLTRIEMLRTLRKAAERDH